MFSLINVPVFMECELCEKLPGTRHCTSCKTNRTTINQIFKELVEAKNEVTKLKLNQGDQT